MATSASPYPSPASSSTSLTFPRSSSPTKDNLRSNPHPYAIKTTSTGILTRSNSTHSSNSASHHFVPSSPTKPKQVNSPRPSGHRYSRSLNAELPRPLPIPPNFPLSASPTKAEFDLQDVPVLTRRERRADTLPSASQPNLVGGIGTDELPDDPRTWTPSQLAAYLTSSLRVTSGDLPPLVAQDIASFVRTQKINGRKFLRLTEGDLDKYGLNQRWQSALLGASRVLRQDSLRGRIWNPAFPSDQQGEQEDDEAASYSSTSSTSSNSVSGSQRGRSGTGRVKGMVASFERNGPSRSVSPVKDSGLGTSPVKRMDDLKSSEVDSAAAINSTTRPRPRPRPQSDIFPSYISHSMPEIATTSTTSASADGDVERKKEPRLLPYPPSSQQILPDATFNVSPQQGIPAFGPYGSPQIPTRDVSFGPFPTGVLPFSPQSTGSMTSPEPMNHMNPISTGGNYIQPQQGFDTLYVNPLTEGVRPLPLPPHPGQIYQPPSSASGQGYGGAMLSDVNYVTDYGVYAPHGNQQAQSVGIVTTTTPLVSVPHVQVQCVSGEGSQVQAPVDVVDSQHYQQEPQQRQPPPQQQQQQTVEILAPQPRHGGRESPTKLLEEKLEELLEPRAKSRSRSRVVPGQSGQAGSGSGSGSGTGTGASPAPSRPRSRVPSMNLVNANGRSKARVPSSTNLAVGEKKSNGAIDGADGSGLLGVGVAQHQHQHHHHHQRTRVISLSSRTHSHRLSGVEVWGENHRHIVVPPDDDDDEDGDGEHESAHRKGGEDVIVKEEEGEEEVGIEAVLEKEGPALPIPVTLSVTKEGKEGNGHGREVSGGSGGGSVVHSRAGSLREPKSAVITVVERKSCSRLRKDELGEKVDAEAEEESMEALLAKADSAALNAAGSIRKKGGKKRAAVSGVEAWEMVGVDTVKHVDGDGMSRSVEDIFSKPGIPPKSQSSTTVAVVAGAQGQTSTLSPSPQTKTKLKPKERRKSGETAERLDELEKREEELERSVGETRRMVDELKGRLEKVELWIAERERQVEVEEERRNARMGVGVGVGSVGVWPVDVVRRVLSASRVPGMLGLSAWFGTTTLVSSAPSSSSSSSAPSAPAPTSTSSQNQRTAQTKVQRQSLMQRFARMTLTMSTYAVLFGIGVCVVVLRALGRKVGLAGRFGVAVTNGVLKR